MESLEWQLTQLLSKSRGAAWASLIAIYSNPQVFLETWDRTCCRFICYDLDLNIYGEHKIYGFLCTIHNQHQSFICYDLDLNIYGEHKIYGFLCTIHNQHQSFYQIPEFGGIWWFGYWGNAAS